MILKSTIKPPFNSRLGQKATMKHTKTSQN
nr:MAG TPA: hypothetical protein [Caudoviricetes sp.]